MDNTKTRRIASDITSGLRHLEIKVRQEKFETEADMYAFRYGYVEGLLKHVLKDLEDEILT